MVGTVRARACVPRSPGPRRRHALRIRAAARRRSRPVHDEQQPLARHLRSVEPRTTSSRSTTRPTLRSASATLARAKTAATHDDITIRDPGYNGVDLRRRIVFSHGLGWLLVDDHASSRAVRTYRQLWHLLPGADPWLSGRTVRTQFAEGNVAILQLRVPDRVNVIEGRRSPIQGWYSTTLNRRKRAPTIEAVLTGRNVRYVTLARADTATRSPSALDGLVHPWAEGAVHAECGRPARARRRSDCEPWR